MVGDLLAMLSDQILDLTPPEVAAADRLRIEQDIGWKLTELAAKPVCERNAEPHLRPREDLRRDDISERTPEHDLSDLPVALLVDRERGGELHETMVQQR